MWTDFLKEFHKFKKKGVNISVAFTTVDSAIHVRILVSLCLRSSWQWHTRESLGISQAPAVCVGAVYA